VPDNHECLLRIHHVIERVGLSRSTIYRMVARGAFPAPRRPAGVSVAVWSASEIDLWIQAALNRRERA